MRRIIISLVALLTLGVSAHALETLDGVEVPDKLLNVYRLYPDSAASRIRAPFGYRPVYLTHYGRHGSRYVKSDTQYSNVESVLSAADSADVLTGLGRELWNDYSPVFPRLDGRTNDLTPLGLEQHKGIAARMMRNFPGLFRDGARVDAVASMSSRTVQSMDAFCDEMLSVRPGLEIERSSTVESMPCLNPYSSKSGTASEWDLIWNGPGTPASSAMERVAEALVDVKPFTERIFADSAWVAGNVDAYEFMNDLYFIAIDMPNTPVELDLCHYFTLSELEALCRVDAFQAYCYKGRYSKDGSTGRQWALGWWILSDIVEKAVSDVSSGEYSARLRFGHDGCFMSMYALLGIEPWGICTADDLEASALWNSSLTPMACNLQLVFFRNRRGRMLVRVLYNENDFELPLKKVRRHCYRPEDLLDFCRPRMEEAKKILDS